MGKKVKPDALISIDDFTITSAGVAKGKKTIKNNKIDIGGTSYSFEVENLIDLSNPLTDLENIL